ncbi:MAG: trehalose-phosphatase [Burkholderiaceae bacterium]|nr:trehalose-phosphatase [Burkholderiaceae bacterium]
MPTTTETVLSRTRFDALIFDLDGVITRTAKLHAKAWKRMFDGYLDSKRRQDGKDYATFDIDADYRRHMDGKPRDEGVQSFLEARAIALPRGDAQDAPTAETICGLGNRKNELFRGFLEREGAQVYEHAIALVKELRAAGFKTAVVSSSESCVAILKSVGALDLFDVKVDGVDAQTRRLKGKPAPDVFLAAAEALHVKPQRAVVVDEALAGVAAGRAAGFGLVIGVDRANQADLLSAHGADVVVTDLAALQVADDGISTGADIPSAMEQFNTIAERVRNRELAVFLDFDGTLAPIVERPEQAALYPAAHDVVCRLARLCPVAVVSGRDLQDVRDRVGISAVYYAGSHGFDIDGPQNTRHEHGKGVEALPALDAAEHKLRTGLKNIVGALVERKRFSVAIHYRLVSEHDVPVVEQAVDTALSQHSGLRKGYGKKVFELQPDTEWDKGAAVNWLLQALALDRAEVLPIYIGDDVTDEDAFRALAGRGLSIVVLDHPRPTAAQYRLNDPEQVCAFLYALVRLLEHAR